MAKAKSTKVSKPAIDGVTIVRDERFGGSIDELADALGVKIEILGDGFQKDLDKNKRPVAKAVISIMPTSEDSLLRSADLKTASAPFRIFTQIGYKAWKKDGRSGECAYMLTQEKDNTSKIVGLNRITKYAVEGSYIAKDGSKVTTYELQSFTPAQGVSYKIVNDYQSGMRSTNFKALQRLLYEVASTLACKHIGVDAETLLNALRYPKWEPKDKQASGGNKKTISKDTASGVAKSKKNVDSTKRGKKAGSKQEPPV